MIIAVIPCRNDDTAKQHIHQAQATAGGIELRIDYAKTLDLDAITTLRYECHIPMIFTLRKKSQGGFYPQDETQRLQDILALCELNPDYIDLEYDVSPLFIEELTSRYPHIKLIRSYHNFEETPTDLMAILQSMQHPCIHAYKLAMTAHSTLDALRLMQFVNTHHAHYRLTGIGMGEAGESTRILSSVVGNAMHYASVDASQTTAPGQLTLKELLTVYSFQKLHRFSKIYALLGDPVSSSVGHILHNQNMAHIHSDAVYITLRVTRDELPEVIHRCRTLPFAGFSITMPLKESIIPLLDAIDPLSQPIKAINSVVLENGKWVGFNTDGIGAIQAITDRTDIATKTVVILGAGGAARAIAYEALRHHARVVVLSRTATRAATLAKELGCDSGDLTDLSRYRGAVIINTLPISAYSEQSTKEWLHPGVFSSASIAMDIVYNPLHTPFLQMAKQANGTTIFGYEMYVNQGVMQIMRWFKPSTQQLHEIKQNMRHYFLSSATDCDWFEEKP